MVFINKEIKKIIGQCTCDDEQGTVFLIDSTIAITAEHCVKEHVDDNNVIVKIEFKNLEDTKRTATLLSPQSFDKELDVAILKLDKPIGEKITYPQLIVDQILDLSGEQWETFGYISSENVVLTKNGTRITGKVLNLDSDSSSRWDIHLECDQTVKKSFDGLSGAPFLISKGNIIGIVTLQSDTLLGAISTNKFKTLLEDNNIRYEKFPNIINKLLEKKLFEIAKYSSSEDVRKTPNWPEKTSVLLLGGESGQGKTWQLAKLATTQSIPTIFVKATGNAEKTLQNAADIIWKDATDHDDSLTIDRIVVHRNPQNRNPWLLICVDDIQDTKEANSLLEKDWQSWGIRLAATVPLTLGRNLSKKYDKVSLIEVTDFDTDELNEYLKYRKNNWQSIPTDIRTTLHRPLLAKLYCDIVKEPDNWKPTNEYQLYEKYWERISEAREQNDHKHDVGKLRQTVGTIFDGHYPWIPEQMDEVGLDDEAHKRLEAIGWLRQTYDNNMEIWHDRLLNWAVAEYLVAQRQSKKISCEELGKKLAELLFDNKKTYAGKRLDYAAMDVLWIMSGKQPPLSTEVHKYIDIIASSARSFRINPDTLYYNLLPTLGKRIIPAIIEHAEALENWHGANHLKITFIEIGKKEANVISEAALYLLDSKNLSPDLQQVAKKNLISDLQQVAIQILSKYPNAGALDKLWEIHKRNDRHRTLNALMACVPLNPSWLIEKIHTTKNDEPTWELAYLLTALDASEIDIWKEVQDKLFNTIPPDQFKYLSICIAHFKDTQNIDWLKNCLNQTQDWNRAYAFVALIKLSPKQALTYLKQIPIYELAPFRKQWLAELSVIFPTEIHQCIWERFTNEPEKFWVIADIYEGNEIDEKTFELLLNNLGQTLSEMIDKIDFSGESSIAPLHMAFSLFSRISRYELLKLLEARANSKLEENIAKLAVLAIENNSCLLGNPNFLTEIKSILLKIGGSGITEVINAELGHPNYFEIRQHGIKDSLLNPDNTTKQKLRQTVQNGITNKIKLQNEDEQQLVVTKLASLGDIETVVDAILHWGGGVAMPDLPNILNDRTSNGQSVIGNELLNKIASYLDSDNLEKRANAVVVIAIIRQKSFISQVRKIFVKAKPDSTLAFICLRAIYELEDTDETIIKYLELHLQDDNHRNLAGNTLLKIGTTKAREALKNYLSNKEELEKNIDLITLFIENNESETELFASIIWEKLQQPKFLIFINPNCLKIVGYLDDPEVARWLWDYISPFDDSGISQERQYALYGLAKSHSEMAFDATYLLLENAEKNKSFLPELFVELDEKRAIHFLCQHLPQEKETLCRWAIGRALRNVEQKNLVYEYISKLLGSSDNIERQAGSELCGWQEIPSHLQDKLFQCATDDVDNTVRRIAIKSLQNQQQHKETLKLIEALKVSQGTKRWSLLEAILQQEDPYLLRNNKDQLWIGRLLDNMPYHFTLYTNERLKQQNKEMDKIAKEIDK